MTGNTPLISVIMPCFNAEEHLGASIESVLSQSYPHLELIVVNDGSTDNSLAILNGYHDPRLRIISQVNQGVCKTRNKAIFEASGDCIAFLDADDTWDKDFLSILYTALSQSPEVALVYCGWQNVGLPGPKGKPYIPPDYENNDKFKCLFENCGWPIHACLTRKYAIIETGGFDERFKTSEDFLLWLKIASKYPLKLAPQVLAYYHHYGDNQATFDKSKIAINHWLAQRSFIQDFPQFASLLSTKTQQKLMSGTLLHRGFECYWNRELQPARKIFRTIMKTGYGSLKDWGYMLPSLLPYRLHLYLISLVESK